MDQPIYEQVMAALQASKQRWPEVARGSGVPVSTVRKIAQRHIGNPGIQHVQSLYDYFRSSAPEMLPGACREAASPVPQPQEVLNG